MLEVLSSVYQEILILIVILVASKFVYHWFFERHFKLGFASAPILSLIYFALWSLVVYLFFTEEVWRLFAEVSAGGYLLLLLVLLGVFPVFFAFLKGQVGVPEWLNSVYPGQGILSLEEAYIIAKVGDVFFQQVAAGALIFTLLSAGLSYEALTGFFVVFFMLAHLYVFKESGLIWGVHYTTYATLGAFAFPFFIVLLPGGVVYSIILHMLFYVISSVFFAILPYPTKAVRRHIGH